MSDFDYLKKRIMKQNKQEKIDLLYLRMAFIWAENSYAIRRHVGCLIVKDETIISDGYNGTPSGFENICEDIVGCKIGGDNWNEFKQCARIVFSKLSQPMYKTVTKRCCDWERGECPHAILKTKSYVLHAESNAIAKLAKSNNSSKGATIYITDEPCLNCAKSIIQAGITRVVYSRSYSVHDGIELLQQANIEIQQIKIEDKMV